jgi:hypothetical protein
MERRRLAAVGVSAITGAGVARYALVTHHRGM